MNEKIEELSRELGEKALARRAVLATAESCTAGGIAYAITEVPGSSAWFSRGFVTYANEAKTEMLGVDPAMIAEFGAVSEQVAGAMARGAVERGGVDFSVAVSGIAGPGGAVPGKPVGTVCFGYGFREAGCAAARTETLHFEGDRRAVREQTVEAALAGLIAAVGQSARDPKDTH